MTLPELYVVRCKRLLAGFCGRKYIPGQLVSADGSPVLRIEAAAIYPFAGNVGFPFEEPVQKNANRILGDYFEAVPLKVVME